MTRTRAIFLSCISIIVVLAIGLALPFDTWSEILSRPWRTLWGSSQQLNATLLEASNSDSMRSMGQHLFKPSGPVKLLREVEPDTKPKS